VGGWLAEWWWQSGNQMIRARVTRATTSSAQGAGRDDNDTEAVLKNAIIKCN